jgi:hypothetical protein
MTSSVKAKVREMREAQVIPEDYYMAKITGIEERKGGKDAKFPGAVNCQANVQIDGGYDIESREEVDLEEERLLGRKFQNFWLGSPDTGNWGGLLRILDAAQEEDIPEGETDDEGNPLIKNMVGVRFPCRSVCNKSGYQGRIENDCIPEIDPDYLEARNKEAFDLDDEDEDEDEPEPEPAPKRRTTKKKKTGKRTRRS